MNAAEPRILLVDDDVDLCRNLSDILPHLGYRVGLAHDVGAAGTQLEDTDFRVVLIDMKIPGGDGSQVFRAVRRANSSARTVLITGNRPEMDPLVDQVLREGADAVCYK